MVCPNCNSPKVALYDKGMMAPFFLKRVYGIEPLNLYTALPERYQKLTTAFPGFLQRRLRLYRPIGCPIAICETCDFVSPGLPLTDDQISTLYRDYRSGTYNAERIRYEPEYAAIAARVGHDPQELKTRLTYMAAFLGDVPGIAKVKTVLDFAGSDGQFIPEVLQKADCSVYEISDVRPCRPEIRRLSDKSQLLTYDYIQICHTLEHVLRPRDMVLEAAGHLADGGLLYLEVPQQQSPEQIDALRGPDGSPFILHEHINLYTLKALNALVESAGLVPLKSNILPADLGWVTGTILGILAAKR
jgi:hypothetical protein